MTKKPLKVLVADDDESVVGLLQSVLAEHPTEFQMVVGCLDGKSAVEEAAKYRPDLVLLDVKMPEINGLEACRKIHEMDPDAVIIIISALGDEEYIREATASGARDYVTKPFKIEDLLETLRREAGLRAQRQQALLSKPTRGEKLSRVWAFWSPRSGAGVTSCAINAALELVRANQTTLYVDLDLVFADSEQLLGLHQMYNLSDLVASTGSFDADSARTRIERHPSGLACLYQHDPGGSQLFGPKHVTQLVHGMGNQFRYLVLDLPSDLSDNTGAALDSADTIWLVAGPDPVAARNITKALGLFHRLGIPRKKVKLLLNRADRRSEPLIRHMLPDEPVAVFPAEDSVFFEAMKTAYPAVLSKPSSGFARKMKQVVAECLSLTTAVVEEPRSITERFLSLLKGG